MFVQLCCFHDLAEAVWLEAREAADLTKTPKVTIDTMEEHRVGSRALKQRDLCHDDQRTPWTRLRHTDLKDQQCLMLLAHVRKNDARLCVNLGAHLMTLTDAPARGEPTVSATDVSSLTTMYAVAS